MIKAAIAGASGTGKTRLMKFISEAYDLPICPIGSRSVAKEMGFDNPYDVDKVPGMRAEFQIQLFTRKRDWELSHENFVTDRTHFDNLAYTAMHDAVTSLPSWAFDAYVDATKAYTRIFALPLGSFQNLGEDPMRIDNPVYHRMFDMLLFGMLNGYSHHNVTVLHELATRQDKVVQILGAARYGVKP